MFDAKTGPRSIHDFGQHLDKAFQPKPKLSFGFGLTNRLLKRQMPRPCATLDRGGVKAVNVQLVPDFFEKAQLALTELAIGGSNVAGQRIGGFKKPFGQSGADHGEKGIQTIIFAHKSINGLRYGFDSLELVVGKHRQVIDLKLNGHKFGCADCFVRYGYRNHDGDERVLGREGGKSVGQWLGPYTMTVKILTLSSMFNRNRSLWHMGCRASIKV